MATLLDDLLPGEELVIERTGYSFVVTRRLRYGLDHASSCVKSESLSPKAVAFAQFDVLADVSRRLGAEVRQAVVSAVMAERKLTPAEAGAFRAAMLGPASLDLANLTAIGNNAD